MSSCLSNAIYSFFTPLVSKAYSSPKPLELNDLESLNDRSRVKEIHEELLVMQTGTKSGLAWLLFRMAFPRLLLAAFLLCIKIAADLSFPLFLRLQLDSIETKGNTDGWIWATAGIVSTLFAVIANQKHIDLAFREGIRLKALCSVLVFDTALYRTSASLDNRGDTTGMILNLVSSDTAKLQELAPLANLLWAAPLQIIIATVLITYLIGVSGFIGVVFLGIGMPTLNYMMIAKIVAYRQRKMKISDERVKLSSEMLAGIRVVKFLSWEARFVERILKVRTDEMVWVSKELHLFATYICILISFPMLSLLVCFGAYVLINPEIPLTAGNAFAALSLFNVRKLSLHFHR
jgi:ATP-binding cassette, subfamily C (CFTR/MRP), member 1